MSVSSIQVQFFSLEYFEYGLAVSKNMEPISMESWCMYVLLAILTIIKVYSTYVVLIISPARNSSPINNKVMHHSHLFSHSGDFPKSGCCLASVT